MGFSPISGPSAWTRRDLTSGDYRIELSPECLDEIRRAADEWRAYPLPTIVLDPADFAMPACRAAMARLRHVLDRGARFAILGQLPLGELDAAAATAVYWLLARMVSRPVAQKLDGTLVYDVLDTGRAALPGSGVRPDKTNIELKFHTDNSYNDTPPDYVALLCLAQAKSGGLSRVMSFHTAHNALLERRPEALPRLYRPFWFDRQREYFPGDSPIRAAPVFERGEELLARFSLHQIRSGYALKGEPIDNDGEAALAGLVDIFDDAALSVDFALEPGEMQFVHNRALGHSRTAFVDHPEPERRRRLVRLWLRDRGRRAYPG